MFYIKRHEQYKIEGEKNRMFECGVDLELGSSEKKRKFVV